jgi:uncharacterized protein YdaU (DUF1376 family)
MAKDPAFLFYPGDWMGGTITMTRHQKGCYMDLLIAQFNNGPLSLETIKIVLGTDQAVWTVLSKKFKEDSEGNFFNEKLATEIEKRKKFISHQHENGSKGGRPKKTHGLTHGLDLAKPKQKPLENENEIEDLNEFEIGKTIEFMKITAQKSISKTVVKDYWKAFNLNNANEFYNGIGDRIQHFRNWLKMQKIVFSGEKNMVL